ncbi:hypothetical protein HDU83_009337 [Entophlyctis luteolus]|nr:hypothetical protein HDU83_009337 [Entophlyctis luteolus]
MAVVTVLLVGAGERGNIYANWILKHPAAAQVVAVCEPNAVRRAECAAKHGIAGEYAVADMAQLPADRRVADAAIVATQDALHADAVCTLARLGYHILCEKPLATTLADCERMRDAVAASGKVFACGHVLRYSPYTRALKAVLEAGEIGDVVNISHIEPVGWHHFAHSYVRGNWRNTARATFSLMAKSCHDVDVLRHYMGAVAAVRVASFGSLRHFTPANRPPRAAARCLDCPLAADETCAYSAVSAYVTRARAFDKGWPVSVVCAGAELECADAVELEDLVVDRLRTTDYGRCVYDVGDNDVCDNQVVIIEFEGGRTATLTMVAFTEAVCQRVTRVHGTKGEIVGDMSTFTVFDFASQNKRKVDPKRIEADNQGLSGHGGGDVGLIQTFIEAVATNDQTKLGCDINDVFDSHRLVFAAEEARLTGKVVNLL